MKMVIHSTHLSPRFLYATQHMLEQILGFELRYTKELEAPSSDHSIDLYYGKERPASALVFIPAHPFLEKSGLESPELKIVETGNLSSFFHCTEISNTDLPFDPFAMVFYLLSRFEEYVDSSQRDDHGRFPAKKSLAFKHGFLGQPLIDCWAWRLYDLLKTKYPSLPAKKTTYSFQPTIDVDFAWAYLHKGWARTAATFFKSLLSFNLNQLTKQIKVILRKEKDPYDTFRSLRTIHEQYQVKAFYFMLLGKFGTYDKNNSPDHPKMQRLIKELSQKAIVGIHPSYASNNSITILQKEKKRLQNILGATVEKSRQHFLKLSLPTTYRRLLKVGIKEDFTMGYADAIGFRASTAYPFYWYDLENEKRTDLLVHPFPVMDVTLKNYLKLSPEEALLKTANLVDQIRQNGGQFCLLWHNSSFSEEMGWEEWQGIYEKIVALASQNQSTK